MSEGKLTPEKYEEMFGKPPPGFERRPIQRITGVLYRSNEVFAAKDIRFDPDRWYPISLNLDSLLPPIGRVRVRHSSLNELTVEGELYQLTPAYPKLAASVQQEGVPSYGRLIGVSVCRENMDHLIPPYQLFPIEAHV